LSLKDLYTLEQVENIKTRNKILKEAHSSRDIATKALYATAEEKKNKKIKQIEKMLKPLGVEKAPKGAENEQWSGKWLVIKEIDLDKEVPKKISLNETDPVFYLPYYRSVRLIKRVKKGKNSDTPEEARRKQKDRDMKQIKVKLKEMSAVRKEFIQNILSGKIEALKDEHQVQEKIWNMLFNIHTGLYPSSMRSFFTGKEDYKCSAEEREQSQAQVDGLSFTHSMLVVMHYSIETIGDIYDWQGYFRPETGKTIAAAYEILKPYGWTFGDEEEQLLNGAHDLYVKPKK